MSILTVSDAAAELNRRYPGAQLIAKDITGIIYGSRTLNTIPVVAGRRMIQPGELDAIAVELRRAGKLPSIPKAVANV